MIISNVVEFGLKDAITAQMLCLGVGWFTISDVVLCVNHHLLPILYRLTVF